LPARRLHADLSVMPHRYLTNRIQFLLERMVLRGAHYRLLVIAMLIGLLSLAAGTVVYLFSAGVDGGFGAAVWWAFLRLSDPGYLGDDEGTLLRFVSTLLTVLGYVVFLGALVAIMTQWLNERMRRLEAGLTPIAERGHVLIIGWTNRTPTIVQELVMSGSRMRRFLELRGARSLRIAILADDVTTRLGVELRDRLGRLWNERQVILRTGSPLRLEHLQRVDFVHAAAVIMPAADFTEGGPDQADTRTVKTLLSMASHPQLEDVTQLPLVVAEVFDSRRIEIARRAYAGPVEILASDAIVSRLLAQTVRHPGLSGIFGELLTHHRGNEVYVRECSVLEGRRFGELAPCFHDAIVIGIVRRVGETFTPLLNPDPATTLLPDDRLAFVARGYAATEPREPEPGPGPPERVTPIPAATPERPLRVLILGWSHKVAALLREFDSYTDERFAIDIVSTTSAGKRKSALERNGVRLERIQVSHVEADFAVPEVLERVDVTGYDSIVLAGSDRLGSGEESDARTIMGYLLLRDILPDDGGTAVVVELLDPGNVPLIRRRSTEVLVTPLIVSHMLAQVALRRELRAVFDELFGPGGAEIVFRKPAEYGIEGRHLTFRDIAGAALRCGEIALGVRAGGGRAEHLVTLNPPRDQEWTLSSGDEVVALTTYGAGS
jgi:ion channel POLLUX/CASTOR